MASQVADGVISQLASIVEIFQGITILDVGFGYGFNAEAMRARGARVFGVEPAAEAYTYAIQNKVFNKDAAFHGRVQDMPEDFANQLDLVTIFLWNIPRSEYDDVLEACSRKIAPQGKIIIGIHDQHYISDPYGCAVMPHVQRFFDNVEKKVFPGKWNKYLLIAQMAKDRGLGQTIDRS